MKTAIFLGAALLLAAPAPAQSVRAGIAAWQEGDHAAAVAIWTPLAEKGDVDAAFNLGQAYRLGKGVAMDHGRAQLYLEQAARTGHADAAATLGIILFQNNDRPAAMKWLRIAAEGGEPRAMLLYGTALYNGDGVAPDAVTAYAYISRAAAQGLDAAKATLADLDAAMPLAAAAQKASRWPGRSSPSPAKAAARHQGRRATRRRATGRRRAGRRAAQRPHLPAAPPASGGTWRIQLGAFAQRATAEALVRPAARQSRRAPAVLRPRGQGHPAPGRPLRQPRRRRGGLRRACGPGLLPRRGALARHPVGALDPLRPQQGVEPVMVEPRIGHRRQRGLGAIGDPQPRRLDHRRVIGAVADRHHVAGIEPQRVARLDQRARLVRGIDDPPRHPPRQPARRAVARTLASTRSNPSMPPTGSAKAVKPPDTSRVIAPRARIVRTRVAAPGLGRTRSARQSVMALSSSPSSKATRSRSAAAKSSSPCIARSVIAAICGLIPA